MSDRISGDFNTVTVLRSWAAATATGATALVLQTKEAGPIAFEVDQRAIDIIRRDLADCERMLKRPRGNA